MTLAAAAIGCTLGNLCSTLRAGKTETKGHQVAYAPPKPVKKAAPKPKAVKPDPKPEAEPKAPKTAGRGTNGHPVFIDGKHYHSRVAASVELGCDERQLARALKADGVLSGRRVSLHPDGPSLVHHRIEPEPRPRGSGPLIVDPVTHRLGHYAGGPE